MEDLVEVNAQRQRPGFVQLVCDELMKAQRLAIAARNE
jgi:hypothetical protein